MMTAQPRLEEKRVGEVRRFSLPRILAGALLLLVAIGGWPRFRRHEAAVGLARAAETAIPVVNVVRAKAAPPNSELILPGNMEAVNVARLYARANGYVRARFADIGSRVKAGQVLAEIESPELDQELLQARSTLEQSLAALEQAKANLEQVRAAVSQAEANLDQAKSNQEIAATTHQRWERLVGKGVLPRQAGDEKRSDFVARQAEVAAMTAALRTARATVNSQQANLLAAQAAVNAQQAGVRRLERMQAFERVVAPFDGVITERKVERGDLVTAGSGGDKNLFSLVQARTLRIQVNVPQAFAVELQPGQTAGVLVRERAGQTFTGTVARTANALDSGSRTLLTEVQVDNSDGALLPGMYTQVKFTLPRARPGIVVPADALVINSQGTRVAVVTPENKLHYIPVQVGRDQGTEVEILDGLKGGEALVSNPRDTIVEGSLVKVRTEGAAKEEHR
jgi:RND family efflux transporter MFP subunit